MQQKNSTEKPWNRKYKENYYGKREREIKKERLRERRREREGERETERQKKEKKKTMELCYLNTPFVRGNKDIINGRGQKGIR